MNYLINYADQAFFQSRALNSISGIQAGFDSVIQYQKKDMSSDFLSENKEILSKKRGAGYWLWKPYFILKTLAKVDDGDVVFYSDAGARFCNHIAPILEAIHLDKNGLFGFCMSGGHKERCYTRKKVIEHVIGSLDGTEETEQRMASFIVAKKSPEAIRILETWFNYCKIPELILDLETTDDDEFPDFVDHRHDQALWSLTTKKLNVTMLPDPTQYGYQETGNQSNYFLEHHRNKK